MVSAEAHTRVTRGWVDILTVRIAGQIPDNADGAVVACASTLNCV